MTRMNPNQEIALVAVLDRIDKQIADSDTLLLKLPVGSELRRITDELAYLRAERRGIAAKLNKHR